MLLLIFAINTIAQQGYANQFTTSATKTNLAVDKNVELLITKFKAYQIATFPVEELSVFLKTSKSTESQFELKLAENVYQINLQQSLRLGSCPHEPFAKIKFMIIG